MVALFPGWACVEQQVLFWHSLARPSEAGVQLRRHVAQAMLTTPAKSRSSDDESSRRQMLPLSFTHQLAHVPEDFAKPIMEPLWLRRVVNSAHEFRSASE